MQPDSLGLLGMGVEGLSVPFSQPETCKACLSSGPTPQPRRMHMPMSLNLSCRSGGITSQIFPLSCFWSPSPLSKAPPTVSSREPPSPLGALRSPETVQSCNSAPPISTREPPHLALCAPPPRLAETRSPRAPEPLAAPARRLRGTEPDRTTGGGSGQPGGFSPNRKCTPIGLF